MTARWSRSIGSAHCRLSTHSTVMRVWAWRRSISVTTAASRSRAPAASRRSNSDGCPSRKKPTSRKRSSSGSPGVRPQTSWARRSMVRRTVSAVASRSSPNRPVKPVTTGAQTSCSPYGAQAVRTTIASDSSASTISSARRVLPAPGSPMIDTTPLWPLRTSWTAASSSARSGTRPTNGTSQRTGRAPAARRTDHEPRLLDPVATADLGDAERLHVDGRGAQRRGRTADEHATGRGQGLQSRRGVHDVTHRRVVADPASVPTSTSPVLMPTRISIREPSSLLAGEAAQRALHAQPGTHGSLGVVLVGDGGAEQGDDAVAEQLVDAAHRTRRCRRRAARSTLRRGA